MISKYSTLSCSYLVNIQWATTFKNKIKINAQRTYIQEEKRNVLEKARFPSHPVGRHRVETPPPSYLSHARHTTHTHVPKLVVRMGLSIRYGFVPQILPTLVRWLRRAVPSVLEWVARMRHATKRLPWRSPRKGPHFRDCVNTTSIHVSGTHRPSSLNRKPHSPWWWEDTPWCFPTARLSGALLSPPHRESLLMRLLWGLPLPPFLNYV